MHAIHFFVFTIDLLWLFLYNSKTMRKFIQTPMVIQDDVLMGRLIGNDLVVYNYLAIKGAHGKPFFFSNQRIGDDLGGMSYGKVSASLNRLARARHIKRVKTCNKTSTQLLTFVSPDKKLKVRGADYENIG